MVTNFIRIFVLVLLGLVNAQSIFAGDWFAEKSSHSLRDLQLRHVMAIKNVENSIDARATEMVSYRLEKSKGKAMLLSLLVPGAGQLYLGHKNWARAYFITEVALWTGVISFDAYSKWRRDDMKTFAAVHAHANITGKPSQYFVDMGNYIDIHEYNDAKQLRREFHKVYDIDRYYWAWENDIQQHDFEQMRISSDRARNRAVFLVGGIIANHVFSAIDAVWKSYRYNKRFRAIRNTPLQFHFAASARGDWRVMMQAAF